MDRTSEGLERFVKAQEYDYGTALREIRNGRKCSHWIWYIFPQIVGLGSSSYSRFYGIRSRKEAEDYLAHPLLGARLREISGELLKLNSSNALEIMGSPDDIKLKSSMTLFALVSDDPVFQKVLDKFFYGKRDQATIRILRKMGDL